MVGKSCKARLLASSALVLACGVFAPAIAQDEQDGVLAPDREEIVVTARFRRESIQDIGQSITAFDGATIESAGIDDFSDIARRTAGLDFNDRGPNANEVSIRGLSKLINQGSLDIIPAQPLVTQFLDDIPITSPTARQRDFNLFDLNRVEVLRGPQPTYFGEGSVGGTIRYFSADPSLDGGVGGKFSADVGHTDGAGDANYNVNGVVDLTLVPGRLGIRALGFYRNDSGFIDNTRTGVSDVNDYETFGGRFVLLAKPTDELTIRAAVHLAYDETGGDWIADDDDGDYEVSFNPFNDNGTDDAQLYSLNVSYDFGPVTATSVTGFYKREIVRNTYDATQSLNSLPGLFGITGDVIGESTALDENFTQELRLVTNFDGPINFTGGFFYKDSETGQLTNARSAELAGLDILGRDLFFGLDGFTGSGTIREHTALFLEANVEPLPGLNIIGGFRWFDETLETPTGAGPVLGDIPSLAVCIATLNGTPTPVFGSNPCVASTLITSNQLLAGIPGAADLEFVVNEVDDILPKFAIEYEVSDTVLLYGSAAKGVRNGGINSTATIALSPEIPLELDSLTYEPDEVWAYEAGAKTAWLDGDLIVNLAVYYNDWSNIQVNQLATAGNFTINAPSARSVGFEVEASLRVSDYVNAFFSGNYTNAEFTEGAELATETNALLLEVLGLDIPPIEEGDKLNNVPEFTFSAGVDYRGPAPAFLGAGFDVIGQVDYQYMDERSASGANELEAFGILNMRAGIGGDDWELAVYARNLANEVANQSFLLVGPAGAQVMPNFLNRPRTVGVVLRKEF